MPSQLAHILHGRACAEIWSEADRDKLHEGAFFLGCQGPDVFYHNQRTRPSGLLYGARIHRWGWGRFCATFAQLGQRAGWAIDHPGFAFLAGWVAHGLLDRALHPYIVWKSGWRVPSDRSTDGLARSHAFFERILDVLLYESREHDNYFHCDWMSRLAGVEDFDASFWTVFAESLWKTYPGAYGLDEAKPRALNAVVDALGFLRWTDPRDETNAREAAWADREDLAGRVVWGSFPRVALFHPAILPPEDFLNRSHQTWLHPVTGTPFHNSVEELFDQACTEGQRAFEFLLSIWKAPPEDMAIMVDELEQMLGNASLNLPGEDGTSQGPKHSKPLDFEHLLDLQRRYFLKE